MNSEEIAKLQYGDEVYWTDPDNGVCSGILRIRTIAITDDVFSICTIDGSEVEGFLSELS